MWTRLVAMLVLTAMLFGGVIGFQIFKERKTADVLANRKAPPVPVMVEKAERRRLEVTLPAIGFLEAREGIQVSASVSGLVSAIHFDSGRPVRAGDLLVELDSGVEQRQLDALLAELPAAESAFRRSVQLAARGTVSEARLDEARAAFQSLSAQVDGLRQTIERRQIRAPFDGVLGIRKISPGNYLQPGTAIATLQNLSAMRTRFVVAQKDLSRFGIGAPVRLTVDAYPDQIFQGSVTAIEPVVEARSGIVQIQAEIPNAGDRLRPGMFAKLEVTLPDTGEAIVVPRTAVTFSLYGTSVYVLRDETASGSDSPVTVARRVEVVTGAARGGDIVIRSGLEPGDRVVTQGGFRLDSGARVTVRGPDSAATPGRTPGGTPGGGPG